MSIKNKIRAEFKHLRASLEHKDQLIAANDLQHQLLSLEHIQNSQHIAGYWPHNNEISPLLFLEKALTMNKKCYLPILIGDDSLLLDFASYKENSKLHKNKFGILEPEKETDTSLVKHLSELDIILVPLVAFDNKGHRIGMGGGYYDATLNKILDLDFNNRPLVIGIGYSFQEHNDIPTDEWDWNLDIIVTDKNIFMVD